MVAEINDGRLVDIAGTLGDSRHRLAVCSAKSDHGVRLPGTSSLLDPESATRCLLDCASFASPVQRRVDVRKLKLLSVAMATGLVLAGCSGPASPGGGEGTETITSTSSVRPDVFDPHNTRSQYDLSFIMPLYDTLIVRDAEGQLQPGIAKDWKLSDHAKVLTLELADGRTFHDGSPIDAKAVKANIEHAAAKGASTAGDFKNFDDAQAEGKSTVTLTFKKPASHMPAVLAMEAGMVANSKYLDDPNFGKGIPEAGSGAFTFVENNNKGFTYSKWSDYHEADSVQYKKFRHIVQGDDNTRLSSIRSGQADFGNIRLGQVEEAKSSGLQVTTNTTGSIYNMRVNASEGPLADANLRRAIMHSLDRDSLNKNFYNGMCEPAVQIFPKNSIAYDPKFDDKKYGDFDPDEAKKILKSSKYDGEEIEILTFSVTLYTTLAEAIQSQLKAVGVKSKITTVETAEYRARYGSGDYQLTVGPAEVNRPEESIYLEDATLPGGSQYAGDFEVPGLQDAIAQSRSAINDTDRAKAFHKFNRIFQEAGPVMIPICHPQMAAASVKELKGLKVPPYYNEQYKLLSKG